MEKKIKFENVVAFINKAIEKEYYIHLDVRDITIGRKMEYTSVDGDKCVYDCFAISWIFDNENNLIIGLNIHYVPVFSNNRDILYTLNVSDPRDIAKWNILLEDVKDYIFSKTEYKFQNFFNEDSKPTTINDLDDEND